MSSSKLDAKHERMLKALLKLPDNRRCAVCESLVRGSHRVLAGLVCEQAWLRKLTLRCFMLRAGPAVCCHQLQYVRVHQLQRRPVRPALLSWQRCACQLRCTSCAHGLIQGARWVCAAGSSITAARA